MTDSAGNSPEDARQPDATRPFLARLFRRASTPLVAGLLLGGCMSDEASALSETSQTLMTRTMNCAQQRWRPMAALKLTEPVDFVALRSTAKGLRPTFTQIDAAGRPCASATSPRMCEAELARVSLLEAAPAGSHLVFTRGDSVRALQTLEQKLSLLGAIDTPDEALLIAHHHGIVPNCGASPNGGDAVEVRSRAEGGYRIALHAPAGCGPLSRIMVDVDGDGALRELERYNVGAPCAAVPDQCASGGSAAGRGPPNLKAQTRVQPAREPPRTRLR